MPRRRTTRNTKKRADPTLPDGDESTVGDYEQRQEKVQTLIQDFQNEVEARLQKLSVMKKELLGQIDLAYTMELMQIPAEIRKMKLTDFLHAGGSFDMNVDASDRFVDVFVESLLISDTGQSQTVTQSAETTENIPPTTMRKGRSRRKRGEPTPSASAQPQTLRRGRSRMQTGDCTTTTAYRTPANRPVPMSMMTPLFTPKFDPRLYQTDKVAKRQPRPDDVVIAMSIDGSPLANAQAGNETVIRVNKSHSVVFRGCNELRDLDADTVHATIGRLQEIVSMMSSDSTSSKPAKKK